MVLAIYKKNPKAFAENNVNTLIKNKKLNIPPVSYFENNSHLEARKILRDQNVAWQNKTTKKNKPIKLKETRNKDAEKIDQLEKELVEAKKKLEEIARLNIDSQRNSIEELNMPLKETLEVEKQEVSSQGKVSESEISQDPYAVSDGGTFVSSISDIEENKIDETEIGKQANNELETIHVLLLALFFVLLSGLFFVISRRKANERNQTLASFFDENESAPGSKSAINPEEKIDIDEGVDGRVFADHLKNKQEHESGDRKRNYLPIADDD